MYKAFNDCKACRENVTAYGRAAASGDAPPTRPARRRLLRLGVSAGGAALLSACGGGGGASAAEELAEPVDAPPSAGSHTGSEGNVGNDDPIAQFLTHDGPSGTSQNCWNFGVDLRWRNPGTGDWLDADGEPQGRRPFAVATVMGAGPVSWDVTDVVRGQLQGENRGLFLRAGGTPFPFRFHGRLAADTAVRPQLLVETDQGVFECNARATARWLIKSISRGDSSSAFTIQQDQSHAIVQFDYSPARGTVARATMTLHVIEAPRKGEVSVFEANPPRYVLGRRVGATLHGLAAQYHRDRGVRNHPGVLFASDFTDGGGNPSMEDWSRNAQEQFPLDFHIDPDTGLAFHRATLRAGQHEVDRVPGSSSMLSKRLVSADQPYGPPTSVLEEVYFRYRCRPNENWRSAVDSTKFPGIDMGFGYWTEGGYWQQVSGNGGVPGDGRHRPSWHKHKDGSPIWAYHGHMARGHGGQYYGDGNPYAELFLRHGTYAYHLDPTDPDYKFGSVFRWGDSVLQRGRWHDIEHHVKVNSLVGEPDQYGNREAAYDGIYEGWIDGQLVFRKTDFRWRRHPLIGVESIWLGFYHGGTQPSPVTMHIDVGSIVVATEYIGPISL